jgi:hypothetical protein
MRAAIRPRVTSPPITPPIIAGVLLMVPPALVLLVGVGVLKEGAREDSTPPML